MREISRREISSVARVERVEAEARLVAARAEGNSHAETAALADLVEITRGQGDIFGLMTYAERAWETAETNSDWSQLARLALVFGDIAYNAQEYGRAFDHYANSTAFASFTGHDDFVATIGHVDTVLAELMATGRGAVAADLADTLVSYEASGGLGRPDPAFSAHYQDAKRQAEERAKGDLARRGIHLN